MRKALELEMTAQPPAAKRGSSSRAMPASSAAKITRGAPWGSAGETGSPATREGIGVFSRHFAVSA
jgi:hypothetical protein